MSIANIKTDNTQAADEIQPFVSSKVSDDAKSTEEEERMRERQKWVDQPNRASGTVPSLAPITDGYIE